MDDIPQIPLAAATMAVSGARPPRSSGSPANHPVTLSSIFHSQSSPDPQAPLYARAGTPAWEPFERLLADLEGIEEPAVLFSSGMAAIDAAFAMASAGHVVVPSNSYNTTLTLADELAAQGRWSVRRVDISNTDEVIDTLDGASLLWIETPTNPMLDIADLQALITAAHRVGVLVAVDNTFATPLAQRPFDFGADIVVHSVTKYLAGHSDLVLGAALTRHREIAQRLRQHRTLHGSIAGPWDAWLALRGMRTLAIRVERAQENAVVLARELAKHDAVAWVRHPSLLSHPNHDRAARQMRGFGSIISFAPRGGEMASEELITRLNLWFPATSLGGVESTIERRRRHVNEPDTVPAELIRLSVGIEDVADLWTDLAHALA